MGQGRIVKHGLDVRRVRLELVHGNLVDLQVVLNQRERDTRCMAHFRTAHGIHAPEARTLLKDGLNVLSATFDNLAVYCL